MTSQQYEFEKWQDDYLSKSAEPNIEYDSDDFHQTIWQASAKHEREAVAGELRGGREALLTAQRFYAKKSRPPTPEYLVKALATLDALLE